MQRNGPALPPGGAGSAPLAGSAATPDGTAPGAASGGGMISDILGKMLSEQNVADQSYPVKMIGNMKRLAAVLIAHMDQSHPEVARDLARVYTGLESALAKAEKAGKANPGPPKLGPPLGFSGAQLSGEPGTATPPPSSTGVL